MRSAGLDPGEAGQLCGGGGGGLDRLEGAGPLAHETVASVSSPNSQVSSRGRGSTLALEMTAPLSILALWVTWHHFE